MATFPTTRRVDAQGSTFNQVSGDQRNTYTTHVNSSGEGDAPHTHEKTVSLNFLQVANWTV